MTSHPWRPSLPALDPATLAFRQALAARTACHAGRSFFVGNEAFVLSLSEPLATYSVGACLKGARGELEVAVECAAWLPELSSELLAAVDDDALARWLDWAAMPWLEALERIAGCAYRVTRAERDVPMPRDAVTLAATRRDGCVGHIALHGDLMDTLAAQLLDGTQARGSAWMRVPATVLFRVRGMSLPRMERLTTGAVLRLYDHDLHIRFGKRPGMYDMQAEWMDDLGIVRAESGARALASPTDDTDTQLLAALDELTFDIDVVLETRTLSMDEARGVCKGAVIALDRSLDGRQVALVSNGKTFARGSLVTVGDRLAVMIDECRASRG